MEDSIIKAYQQLIATHDLKIDAIRAILQQHPELITVSDEVGWTFFQYAISRQSLDGVKLVHEFKIPMNDPLKGGVPPIHFAAATGNLEIFEQIVRFAVQDGLPLLEFIDDVHDKHGSAMHVAAAGGHDKIIRSLFRMGSQMVDRCLERMLSAEEKNLMIHLQDEGIRDQFARRLSQGPTPLQEAMKYGQVRVIDVLNQLGVPMVGRNLLFDAVVEGHPTVIEMLIRLGCDVEMDQPLSAGIFHRGHTPILCALIYNRYHYVHMLRALGAAGATADMDFLNLEQNMTTAMRVALTEPLEEDYVLLVRGRIYFETSLTWRLLRLVGD